MILKDSVKENFNKAWGSYDDYCFVQKTVCDKALRMAASFPVLQKVAIDFACGTGVSTSALLRFFNFNKIYAVDFSDKLLSLARKKIKRKNVEFIAADFDENLFPPCSADFVFSSMGLQWSFDLKNTLLLFQYYLKVSGAFVFTIPLRGTFCELQVGVKNKFYAMNEVFSLLKNAGYHLLKFDEFSHVDTFDSVVNAFRSIKAVGANTVLHSGADNMQSKRTLKNKFIDNNNISLTYKVGIFMAVKI